MRSFWLFSCLADSLAARCRKAYSGVILVNTLAIDGWFKTLAIDEMCQWDVLVFLHHRRTTLLSAEQIARFMCYGTAPVVTALDHLESLGMVERSRLSQGARLHRLIELDGPRAEAFKELMALTESRSGRLAMSDKLLNPGSGAKIVELNIGKPLEKEVRFRDRKSLVAGKGGK